MSRRAAPCGAPPDGAPALGSKIYFTAPLQESRRRGEVGPQYPAANAHAPLACLAYADVDSSVRNRVEWILTSEGTFRGMAIIDGRGERPTNRKLGTKLEEPRARHRPAWHEFISS